MTYRDFCYWLQGHFEIGNVTELTPDQIVIIKNHLNMVFIHERGSSTSATTKAPGVRLEPAPRRGHTKDGEFEAMC